MQDIKNNKNLKEKKLLTFFIVFGLIGLIIGSFYDLDINKALYKRGTLFPSFFRLFGEFPLIIWVDSLGFAYMRENWKNKDKKFYFIGLSIIMFTLISSIGVPKYFHKSNIIYSFILGVFYISLSFFISKKLHTNNHKDFSSFVVKTIVTMILIILIVNILKNIWTRMRFYEMINQASYDGFTNWWVISGNRRLEAYRSFPSGHTASAASILSMVYLKRYFDFKKIDYLCIYFPSIWTLLVFFARIFDGAHFLSDVSFGLLIASSLIYLLGVSLDRVKK